MDVSAETLRRTSLGDLKAGDRVNLERCLTLDTLLNGHLVAGPRRRVGRVVSIKPEGDSKLYTFEVAANEARYLIEKGSVAIDGITLTVFSIRGRRFNCELIPHTLKVTTMGFREAGRQGECRDRHAGEVRRADFGRTRQGERRDLMSKCSAPARRLGFGGELMSLMQIPRKIEYALRAMIYLADRPNGVARGSEIARHEQIPKYYLEKVIRDLMHRGLVHARRGPGGGYQLARPASNISFRDIIEAVEGPITLNVCTDGSSSCALQPTCRMYRVWEKGQRVLFEVFSDTSLQEIASTRMSTGFPRNCLPSR